MYMHASLATSASQQLAHITLQYTKQRLTAGLIMSNLNILLICAAARACTTTAAGNHPIVTA